MGAPVRHRLRVHVHEYELPYGVTRIGRGSTCRIVIEDPTISRDHAEIVIDDKSVRLRDLASRNGTFVDGERIEEEIELRDGARLRLGTVDVRLVACHPRAPMRSTLRLRACGACGATFSFEERRCPKCGEPARDEDWLLGEGVIRTPVDATKRRSWWLELHVDLVERALSLWRLDDAQRTLQRIEDGLAEHREGVADATFERAFDAAIRSSVARGDASWIRWTLQTHLALRRVPSRAVVDRLRSLPPILLEDVRDVLSVVATELAHSGDDDASERLDVLRALRIEIDRLRAKPTDDETRTQEEPEKPAPATETEDRPTTG